MNKFEQANNSSNTHVDIVHSLFLFFFSSRRRHTRYIGDWSSDVCSSDLSSTPTLRKARSWFFSFLEGRTIQPCPSTAWVAHRTTAGRGTFSTVRKNAELGRALVSFLPRSGSCEPCSWPRSENWRRKDDGLAALRELACTLDIIATANKALITARAGRKRVL